MHKTNTETEDHLALALSAEERDQVDHHSKKFRQHSWTHTS